MKKKMIRIMALVLIMAIGFSTVAFAGTAEKADKTENQAIRAEIATLKIEFLNNRSELLSQKSNIAATYAEIKQKLLDLKSDDSDLTQEELDLIKESLAQIKSDRTELKAINVDSLKPLLVEYKDALTAKDFETAKATLEEILTIQGDKSAALQKIQEDMDALMNLL